MSIESLDFGDSVSGLLIDGVDGTPYVGANMKMSEPHGVRVEVPYLSQGQSNQFSHVESWFRNRTPPDNLLLVTADGPVSLFGLRWAGRAERSGYSTSLGMLDPSETVLAMRDGALTDPLLFRRMQSRLDGLNSWVCATTVRYDTETDGDGRTNKVTVALEGQVLASWKQGDAKMAVRSQWEIGNVEDAYERSANISDNCVIESEFEGGPRSYLEHYKEQRKFATLLVLLFGQPIAFRQHHVKDERFTEHLADGEIYDYPFVELISARTARERTLPILSKEDLAQPLAHLPQIGADGLAEWAARYDEWARFIVPSAGVLGRSGAFVEDMVISTSMSLEAAGQLIGKVADEEETYGRAKKPTTATYVLRCLGRVGVKWGPYIESEVGAARAIANNYNSVKHPDRGDFPTHEQTVLTSRVNRLIVRLLVLDLTGKGDELLKPYREGRLLWPIQQEFEARNLRVTAEGTWETTI